MAARRSVPRPGAARSCRCSSRWGSAVAVAWLLAERNARQWWIVPEDGQGGREEGGLLRRPARRTFKSADPETARTYAPIPPPQGGAAPVESAYDDRAELDQALFELLARWARADIQSQQMERMERARGYLGRASRLAGLSPAQREQLRVLQAETAFQEAVEHLTQGANALRRALEGLRLAAEARGPVAAEAAALEKSLEPVAASTGQLMLEASRFAAERYRPAPRRPGRARAHRRPGSMTKPVRLAILWHMHQPLYREPATGKYLMPWVRLHATRAYYDMAWILERHPGVRCTVNFTPVLLEQLEDYVAGRARDRFLDLTARDPRRPRPGGAAPAAPLLLHGGLGPLVRPVPRYWELLQKRGRDLARVDLRRGGPDLHRQELPTCRCSSTWPGWASAALADDPALRGAARARARLRGRRRGLRARRPAADPRRRWSPRWRALAERGQVELSTTPYHHPILPLVCDTDAAARALPGVALPPALRLARRTPAARRADALASHARRFGRPAAGMWPAEGAVSPEALEVLAAEGVAWAGLRRGGAAPLAAPGEPAGRARSTAPGASPPATGRSPCSSATGRISDLIGFSYARAAGRRRPSPTSPSVSWRPARPGGATGGRGRPRWASSSTARTPGSATRAPATTSSTPSTGPSARTPGSRP